MLLLVGVQALDALRVPIFPLGPRAQLTLSSLLVQHMKCRVGLLCMPMVA